VRDPPNGAILNDLEGPVTPILSVWPRPFPSSLYQM